MVRLVLVSPVEGRHTWGGPHIVLSAVLWWNKFSGDEMLYEASAMAPLLLDPIGQWVCIKYENMFQQEIERHPWFIATGQLWMEPNQPKPSLLPSDPGGHLAAGQGGLLLPARWWCWPAGRGAPLHILLQVMANAGHDSNNGWKQSILRKALLLSHPWANIRVLIIHA